MEKSNTCNLCASYWVTQLTIYNNITTRKKYDEWMKKEKNFFHSKKGKVLQLEQLFGSRFRQKVTSLSIISSIASFARDFSLHKISRYAYLPGKLNSLENQPWKPFNETIPD